jgi:hypothetical protein
MDTTERPNRMEGALSAQKEATAQNKLRVSTAEGRACLLGSFIPALLLTDSCGRCSKKSRANSSACCCYRSDTLTDARG